MPSLTDLAARPDVIQIVEILHALEDRGLTTPAVASGFPRSLLLDAPPSDVDIHYTGVVPTVQAEEWLHAELAARKVFSTDWDIWNFTEHDARITTIEFGYLAHFVSTIDCVYIAADGQLHDLTGRGVADAEARLLEFTHPYVQQYSWTPGQLCYLLLEGCRRIFLYGLTPTPEATRHLREGVVLWDAAIATDRTYLHKRLYHKLDALQREAARPIYEQYGWGAVFADASYSTGSG
jgi:hypothetical protein